ncbi:SAM-dependent methyltransferase, partial [Streptomyces sp. A475]
PDEVEWWSGLWADRTLASAYADRATESGHATAGQLEEISEAWRTWGKRPDAWFSVLHGEILCRKADREGTAS